MDRRRTLASTLTCIPIWVLAIGCSTTSRGQSSIDPYVGTTSQDAQSPQLGSVIQAPTTYFASCIDRTHIVTHATYCDGGEQDTCRVEDTMGECPCLDGRCRNGSLGDPWADAAPDALPMPPQPPDVACDSLDPGDAADPSAWDGSACDLPRSLCLDGWWIGYYTNARCIEGRCRWDVSYRACGGGCSNGGCVLNITR